MNTFFISDLHFNHINIMKYGRNKFFSDLDHMREMIIVNHNNHVSPEDLVIVVGDVVMGKRAESLPHIARMNGNKILVMGNHDYPHPCNSEKFRDKWTSEYGQYFTSMTLEMDMEIAGARVKVCHFPIALDHTEDVRYEEYRPSLSGYDFLIHGHLHCEEISPAPQHIHVGIDADYTAYGVPRFSPIPLSVIEQVIRSQT